MYSFTQTVQFFSCITLPAKTAQWDKWEPEISGICQQFGRNRIVKNSRISGQSEPDIRYIPNVTVIFYIYFSSTWRSCKAPLTEARWQFCLFAHLLFRFIVIKGASSIDWLIDWLTDSLTDWLSDCRHESTSAGRRPSLRYGDACPCRQRKVRTASCSINVLWGTLLILHRKSSILTSIWKTDSPGHKPSPK